MCVCVCVGVCVCVHACVSVCVCVGGGGVDTLDDHRVRYNVNVRYSVPMTVFALVDLIPQDLSCPAFYPAAVDKSTVSSSSPGWGDSCNSDREPSNSSVLLCSVADITVFYKL